MKKFWMFLVWLCSVFFAWNFTLANSEYEYANLNIIANIMKDWTINVNEGFTANFFVQKHWIIRDIPLNYSVWWKDFHIEISDINVQWKTFTTNKSNWNIEIKIWDANRTVIWEQEYPISYDAYGLIRNFSWMGYAELYWNLVGYNFDTNINNVRVEIILPKIYTGFTSEDFLITTDWESKTIDWFQWTVDWSEWNRIIINYDKWLSAYQGITLAIKFPNNYFEFNHERQAKLVGFVWNSMGYTLDWRELLLNWPKLLLCLFILVILFSIICGPFIAFFVVLIKFIVKLIKEKWFEIKKEFREKYPVIIQYNPPKWLNSAEVWILLHRYNNPKDTFSLVYKWAHEWFIKIKSWKKNEYSIVKIMDINWDYPKYEKFLFKQLFSKNELKLNHKTYLYNKLTKSWIQSYWIEKWRFIKKEKIYWCNSIWCLYVILIFIWTPLLSITFPPLGIVFFFILFFIWVFWGERWRLQQKILDETEEGAKLISHILWYKQFLKSCDEKKLKTFLQQDPLYFDKILPYAVVFGLDTELIKKFTHIMQEMDVKPSWYDWDIKSLCAATHIINKMAYSQKSSNHNYSWWSSSYSSSSWFDSWSSFSWGWSSFSSWWGGWGWGWTSR